MIQLGETSSLSKQADRLRGSGDPSTDDQSLEKIVDHLNSERYSDAVSCIDDYLQSEAAVQKYQDPRLSALRLEAEALEDHLAKLESEKVEIEREIHAFNLRHEQELGPILEEILEIQVEKKRERAEEYPEDEEAKAKYEQARKEHEEYSQTVEDAQEEERIELTEEETDELKDLYRSASKQCHPDAVEEANEEEAQELFVELQEAYEQNDLEAVRNIASRVERGAFGSRSEEVDDVEKMEEEVERLQEHVEELEREIDALQESDAYQTITDVDDLDVYFADRKERLEDELTRLREEEPISQ
jgi:chromosome segregation ATPase